MKNSTKIIAVTVLTLGVASGVFAYGAHGGWKMSPEKKAGYMTDMITENLELNTMQQENLKALSVTVLEMMNEVRSDRAEHMELMQQFLSQPTLDQAKALQMVQQKTQMINDKAPQIIGSIAGFLDSLDSEQKKELREHMGERMSRHHQNH
jgi:ABC-type nitrate/sulfonate/bicarbonate transport system substrate-binding protein